MRKQFKQLGEKGKTPNSPKEAYLEMFKNPGVSEVEFITEECTSLCPVTGQPDFFTIIVIYTPDDVCIESKSLKLYLQSFRNEKAFIEELSFKIYTRLNDELQPTDLKVQIKSVSRGGLKLNVTTTD